MHVAADAAPAIQPAAKILGGKLEIAVTSDAIQGGDIVLATDPKAAANDGYRITFQGGMAKVAATRPRSLLYAAGDVGQ